MVGIHHPGPAARLFGSGIEGRLTTFTGAPRRRLDMAAKRPIRPPEGGRLAFSPSGKNGLLHRSKH